MANPLPVGVRQRLRFSDLELELTNCKFNPEGQAGLLGYKRTVNQQLNYTLQHTINGTAYIKSRKHAMRHDFTWSLILDVADLYILTTMRDAQHEAIRINAETVPVRLLDERLVFPAYTSPERYRAKVGTFSDALPAITNYEYIWPQFDVLITSLDWSPLILPHDKFAVELAASELNLVPISEDIA